MRARTDYSLYWTFNEVKLFPGQATGTHPLEDAGERDSLAHRYDDVELAAPRTIQDGSSNGQPFATRMTGRRTERARQWVALTKMPPVDPRSKKRFVAHLREKSRRSVCAPSTSATRHVACHAYPPEAD